MPKPRLWPRTVTWVMCPECRMHGAVHLDGQPVRYEDVISVQCAMVLLLQLVKRRRITYEQAMLLCEPIARSGLPVDQATAMARIKKLDRTRPDNDPLTRFLAGLNFPGSPTRH